VADSSLLPVTLGSPALDSVFLAKAGSGLWLISRRPAGLYVRVANNGVAADWTYLGSFPEVNADANWELYNSTDPTKELKFDLSGLPTATIRTVTGPAGNGQMMVSGQAGSFTTLTANNGTLAASAPVLDLAQTWNNAATTFTGLLFNATNTASSATSSLFDFQVGGTSALRLERSGTLFTGVSTTVSALTHRVNFASFDISGGGGAGGARIRFHGSGEGSQSMPFWAISGGYNFNTGAGTSGGSGFFLHAEANNVCGLRSAANAQEFRIYNTFTSATNHERGFLKWSSNVFQIGTEAGSGGGTARAMELQTNGATRFTIATNGAITCSSSLSVTSQIVFQGNANIAGNIGSGIIRLNNHLSTGFDRLQFGGGTTSFPALKRDSTVLQARLANDSDFCPLQGQLRIHQNAVAETPTATHTMTLFDAAGTAYKVLCVAA
jgi:hypothetical protein